MKLEGTTLVVVNVVVLLEMRVREPNEFRRSKKPDHLITVLQELIKMLLMLQDNTCSLSSFIASYGFVQKRRISTHVERHHIEGRPAELIAENLQDAFNEYC
jgi:putative YphP/YqiW family bacilliredoxin